MREHAVTLYVRADAPIPDRRRAVLDRLQQLRRRGELSDVTVHPWPRAVSLSVLSAGDGAGILGTVRQFEEWADRTGRELRPSFDRRSADSTLTGESDELLVLPVLCLAAFAGDRVVGVYPSAADGSTTSVEDALERLEDGSAWSRPAATPEGPDGTASEPPAADGARPERDRSSPERDRPPSDRGRYPAMADGERPGSSASPRSRGPSESPSTGTPSTDRESGVRSAARERDRRSTATRLTDTATRLSDPPLEEGGSSGDSDGASPGPPGSEAR